MLLAQKGATTSSLTGHALTPFFCSNSLLLLVTCGSTVGAGVLLDSVDAELDSEKDSGVVTPSLESRDVASASDREEEFSDVEVSGRAVVAAGDEVSGEGTGDSEDGISVSFVT